MEKTDSSEADEANDAITFKAMFAQLEIDGSVWPKLVALSGGLADGQISVGVMEAAFKEAWNAGRAAAWAECAVNGCPTQDVGE